ncbi:MAG TPA: zinc ABC transporter substrate-binding protein [Candidatus Hydrogenedentes bacterium]|nr:zinc ABC transporter substrate-binding protein [Candidatus Hydrogenedentota bacterium]HOJ67654.1 zinc ABC transporter substrate-binding protein [Candidatus Hydrogenedentota bacterium]HOK89284.1 zinc ABC transporter substrate-binding protein [Candidatus Hydrogenedentota bacterium]
MISAVRLMLTGRWILNGMVGIAAMCFAVTGCSGDPKTRTTESQADSGTGPLVIAVTVEPLNWLVSTLGSDAARAVTVVPSGQNHETWQPAPGHMDTLARAAVYFESGMPFEEPLIERLRGLNPSLEAVCLLDAVTEKIPPPQIAPEETRDTKPEEDHGEPRQDLHGGEVHDHGHDHGDGDPHFWTDPQAMICAAERIAEVLSRHLPEQADSIREKLETVRRDLRQLDTEIAGMLEPVKGRPYYVFHPETGWFARRYGLVERAVEQHGKTPGARDLDALAREIGASGVTALITQPGYPASEMKALARQLNLRVLEVDLNRLNYPEAIRALAQATRESFAPAAP